MQRIVPDSWREMGGSKVLMVRMVVVGCMVISKGEEPVNLRTCTGVEEEMAEPTETMLVRRW